MTTVCVVGSGGREHALADVLARSADVVVTPGNPGMPRARSSSNGHEIRVSDLEPEAIDADLVVIGPEVPLVDGLADRLRALGRAVVGPGAQGAKLEGSKAFMKEMLNFAKIPTAQFSVFDSNQCDDALKFLDERSSSEGWGASGLWVVKTDGLAAGKGVLVTGDIEVAKADVVAKLSGDAFSNSGRRVVIEEGLNGVECSLLVLCDGRNIAPLAPARDFKRIGSGDTGPNTGGMGAYSPLPDVDDRLVDRLMDEAVEPLVGAMISRGIDYRGVLYAGIMLTADGPKVLEYNVRFGDPETQVVLPRLADDLVDLLMGVADGNLASSLRSPRFASESSVCVVMAARGYPDAPLQGDVIWGLDDTGQLARSVPGVSVYHAGTTRDLNSSSRPFVTAGGRVLGISALGPTIEKARSLAYQGAESVNWDGCQVRDDIAAVTVLASTREVNF